MAPTPNRPAPQLRLALTDGSLWSLDVAPPEAFTMVVFYRGLHCCSCRAYLRELAHKHAAFRERGVRVLAASMDPLARARAAVEDWQLGELDVGWGLSEAAARAWGLYISEAIKGNEPPRFCEPGLFLVRGDGRLHYAAINSMPFGRPNLDDVLVGIDYIQINDYPARGCAVERARRACA